MAEREGARHSYSASNRMGRYAGAFIFAALALGCAILSLSGLDERSRAGVMAALSLPTALLAWWALRGALERRHSFIVDARGLSIVSSGGQARSFQWDEIRVLHHGGRSLDPHLSVRMERNGGVWRIYYDIDHASD